MRFLIHFAHFGRKYRYITKKTERENRKAELGPVHKRIIEFISRYLMECEESVVEDFLLDSEKQLKLVNSFIQKGLLLSSSTTSCLTPPEFSWNIF